MLKAALHPEHQDREYNCFLSLEVKTETTSFYSYHHMNHLQIWAVISRQTVDARSFEGAGHLNR